MVTQNSSRVDYFLFLLEIVGFCINNIHMNETLIKTWNSQVKDHDTVYILGDLCFRMNKEETYYLIKRLKGHKILIGHIPLLIAFLPPFIGKMVRIIQIF